MLIILNPNSFLTIAVLPARTARIRGVLQVQCMYNQIHCINSVHTYYYIVQSTCLHNTHKHSQHFKDLLSLFIEGVSCCIFLVQEIHKLGTVMEDGQRQGSIALLEHMNENTMKQPKSTMTSKSNSAQCTHHACMHKDIRLKHKETVASLTLSLASTNAPKSRSLSPICTLFFRAARCMGVRPTLLGRFTDR